MPATATDLAQALLDPALFVRDPRSGGRLPVGIGQEGSARAGRRAPLRGVSTNQAWAISAADEELAGRP